MHVCPTPNIPKKWCPDSYPLLSLPNFQSPCLLGNLSSDLVSPQFLCYSLCFNNSTAIYYQDPPVSHLTSFNYCIIPLLCIIAILSSVTSWNLKGLWIFASDWFTNLEVICPLYGSIAFLSCFNSKLVSLCLNELLYSGCLGDISIVFGFSYIVLYSLC